MTKNAIIYARFSSLEQSKGYSLERQMKNGREYVEHNGWRVEAEIKDEGKSAFSGSNRAEGTALHTFEIEARSGQHSGKVLCVENIDRLSRQGAKAAAQLVWALNEQGVDVATWHDGFIYKADGSGDLMELFSVIIKAQMAYEESKKKSQRSRDNWKKKYKEIQEGKGTFGGKPAWIEIEDGKHVLNEERAKVINDIFDWYIDGLGYMAIVQRLNDRNEPVWHTKEYKNPKGGWQFSYVHRLINGRTVLGEFQKNGTDTISTNFYPAAVTLEKYNRAQSVMIGKPKLAGRDSKRKNNLLSGLVRCGACGKVAGYENKGNSKHRYVTKGGEVRFYGVTTGNHESLICDAYRRKHGCDNAQRLYYRVVEKAVLDTVLSLTIDDEQDSAEQQQARDHVATIERDIAAKTLQMNNLVEALADGGAKAIVSRVAALENEIEHLQSQLRNANEHLLIVSASPSVFDDAEFIRNLRDELTSDDPDIRLYARTKTNAALKRVIEEVTILPDGTFYVYADIAIWHFDREGNCIGGQAI
ncbi:recombinase family protein [Sphingobium sp. LMC3-1-1.1]|uniref:recombinase family protein n=1 Tax=Sphingobium sp. LMC3-1-1.1 TaxID=3135241 RepID=UPI00342E0541